jgi:putative FmdB family regulatory protein
MPTYEYRCTACGHDFEKFQRMSDQPGAECPECASRAERRLSGGAGLLFKGSGFYITDYRSDSYKSAAKADSGSGESKPAAGKEAAPSPKPEKAKSEARPSGKSE